jgi:hypothetical protein
MSSICSFPHPHRRPKTWTDARMYLYGPSHWGQGDCGGWSPAAGASMCSCIIWSSCSPKFVHARACKCISDLIPNKCAPCKFHWPGLAARWDVRCITNSKVVVHALRRRIPPSFIPYYRAVVVQAGCQGEGMRAGSRESLRKQDW